MVVEWWLRVTQGVKNTDIQAIFLCSLIGEALHLNEHEAAKWLAKDELYSVKWLPADVKVVEALMKGTL